MFWLFNLCWQHGPVLVLVQVLCLCLVLCLVQVQILCLVLCLVQVLDGCSAGSAADVTSVQT